MDQRVRDYIDGIDPAYRPLFDRLQGLILRVRPEAEVVIGYQMPSYKADGRRLYLGVWRHGVSVYGWREGADGGFVARHPALRTGKGTIRLRPEEAEKISDAEFMKLFRAAFGAS